jgi:hypothetical protein
VELFHLAHGKIADADSADLSLPVEGLHRIRGFFNRGKWVWPVNLVDIDMIGLKPPQGFLDFELDPFPAGIAEDLAISPFKPGLGGDKHAGTQAAVSDCPNP